MSDKAGAYADALIRIAEAEDHVERIEDELFRVARSFESSDELRLTLTDATIPLDRRIGVIEDLLTGKALPLTIAMVTFIVAAERARDLPGIVDAYVAKAAERRAEAVAEVRSAISLDEEQQRRLAEALGKATGKRVSVKVIVDPSVLGGLIARVGDTVIDGSVRHRLDQLKESV